MMCGRNYLQAKFCSRIENRVPYGFSVDVRVFNVNLIALLPSETRLTNDHRDALDPLPLLFLYSTEERAWSAAFEADGSASWRFEEVADGAHGTNMFGAAPATIELVADFLADAL